MTSPTVPPPGHPDPASPASPVPPVPAATASLGTDFHPFRYGAALAATIETSWQDRWERDHTFHAPNPGEAGFDAKPKKFILDMFPYPSGAGLHVGHPLGYIATDIFARFLRMTGHNVLHAMGFDSFGLPAEQYAVQTNTHPRITTERNIASMKQQLRRLGLGHDPRRAVSTTDEPFYKWTQWIFLKIYNSWYDESAPESSGSAGSSSSPSTPGTPSSPSAPTASGPTTSFGPVTQGRARPIADLINQFESGERPIPGHDKPWSQLSLAAKSAVLDHFRLAHLAQQPVNWCPMLGTVLANEEVTTDGRSERGNYPVFKRPLKQWVLRITSYAHRLLSDLDPLAWPEPIKQMQRNWIGKSEGAYIDFACNTRRVRVFTTRPDTLFGATYLVLSPEHEMVEHLAADKYAETKFAKAIFPGAAQLLESNAPPPPHELIAAYRAYAKAKPDDERAAGKDKTGVFIGAYALNPVSNERLPVFIADYVLSGYGTAAIMAVPAHDDRDFEFAKAFNLRITQVVKPNPPAPNTPAISPLPPDTAFTGEGIAINSGQINTLPTPLAKIKIIESLERTGRGKRHINYKLRDWLFSRQRYWGEPFPIVFDESGLACDLPESMLPVLLPHVENFKPESSDDPNAPVVTPLGRATDWVNCSLDLGDGRGTRPFTRETNTMPNWAGSCWYYLRYLDPTNENALVGKEAEQYWMVSKKADGTPHFGGVDLYVGGVEHAVLHLLYARFWHKVLFDLGYVSTPEPFGRLFNQGYIQAFAFKDARGIYVDAFKVTLQDGSLAFENQENAGPFAFEGQPVTREYGKMGKSLKNAVAPDDICEQYGCDTLRVYEMSMGPLEASKPWATRDIAGAHRFLQRVWRLIIDEQTGTTRVTDAPLSTASTRLMHKTIKGVRADMATLGFNTAVAKLIELNNDFTKQFGVDTKQPLPRAAAETLALMLAPFAPHMAEELWQRLGHTTSLAHAPFPQHDDALAADDEIEIPVQIQGKLRAKITVPAGSDAKTIEAAAMASDDVKKHLEGKAIKKVIVVPGKMVNLVLG